MTIRSSSRAGAIDTSDARPNFVASSSAIVRAAAPRAALNTSASAPREVVSPASSVMPAADTNAVSKRSPRRNSSVQRPATVRVCWSSSPGQTTTWSCSARTSAAMIGELVTSVSSYGGSSVRRRASASALDEASRKIVDPPAIIVAASSAIAAFAAHAWPTRWSHAVGCACGPGSCASARAPPRTRSTSPSRASCSRSRWAVIVETAWSRASSATVAPPRRWICSRICARRSDAGSVLIVVRRADAARAYMCARSVLTDSSTSHE